MNLVKKVYSRLDEKKLISLCIVLLVAFSFFSIAKHIQQADAALCPYTPTGQKQLGRCSWFSFYHNYNIYDDWPNGLYQPDYLEHSKVQNKTQFISQVQNALYGDFSGCDGFGKPGNWQEGAASWPSCYRIKAKAVHASFLVNSMMGYKGTDFDGQNYKKGIETAQANFNKPGTDQDWVGLINLYEDNNWVQWNAVVNYRCSSVGNIPSWNSASWGKDTTWIQNCTSGEDDFRQTIKFQVAGSTESYDIVKFCANVKNADPLKDYKVVADLSSLPSEVEPGDELTVTASIENKGNLNSPIPTWLRIHNKQPPGNNNQALSKDIVEPVSISPSYPLSYFGSNASSNGYSTSSSTLCGPSYNPSITDARKPCWYFKYDGQNNGPGNDNDFGIAQPNGYGLLSKYDVTIKFKVKDTAQDGDQICLLATATPHKRTTDEHTSGPTCTTVRAPVIEAPYVKFYGNDVLTGAQFFDDDSGSCTIDSDSTDLKTFDKKITDDSYVGSSSQLGAFVKGDIENAGSKGFFTANLRNAKSSPHPATGLTIGNYDGALVLNEGGGDSGVAHCLSDIYDESKASPASQFNSLTGSGSISADTRETLYFEGDIFINKNISYQNSGSWTALSQIPNLRVVVKGNIYISPSVSNLDGTYIALPTVSGASVAGGKIITCANSSGNFTNDQILAQCNSKLTVNGAFVAYSVEFLRRKGDLYTTAILDEPASDPDIAEVFNFSPESYIVPLDPSSSRDVKYKKYDYITSLPPIL